MTTTVFHVAKYILQHTGDITTMKLQKICYYCQAYNLAWTGKPLFPNKIYAWKNGPVCRELFNFHRGKFIISKDDFKLYNTDDIPKTDKIVVKHVTQSLQGYSAEQLRDLSHTEKPWIDARELGSSHEITNDIMQKFYSSK